MHSDNFVPDDTPQLVPGETLDAMASHIPHATIVRVEEVSEHDLVLARERDGDRVLVTPSTPGRTRERGVTGYERVIEIAGKRIVVPAGAPVVRGTVRWGDAAGPDRAPEDPSDA
jgi:hypothetical protein